MLCLGSGPRCSVVSRIRRTSPHRSAHCNLWCTFADAAYKANAEEPSPGSRGWRQHVRSRTSMRPHGLSCGELPCRGFGRGWTACARTQGLRIDHGRREPEDLLQAGRRASFDLREPKKTETVRWRRKSRLSREGRSVQHRRCECLGTGLHRPHPPHSPPSPLR